MALSVLAKMFYATYRLEEVYAEGWVARTVQGGGLELKGPEGIWTPARLGQTFEEGVICERGGLICLGDAIVLSEQTHWHQMRARQGRGGKSARYYLDLPDGRVITATLGEAVHGFDGPLEENDNGQLVLQGKVVPRSVKDREISLIVFDQEREGGHLAYFNVFTDGSRSSPHGISGFFVRGHQGVGEFFQEGSDGAWHNTARFSYSEPGSPYARGSIRSCESAQAISLIDRQIVAIEREARELGLQVNDFQEHEGLKRQRDELAGTWQEHRFVVASGPKWLAQPDRREPRSDQQPKRGAQGPRRAKVRSALHLASPAPF